MARHKNELNIVQTDKLSLIKRFSYSIISHIYPLYQIIIYIGFS